MKEFNSFDDLAVFVINHFAEVFKNHAVLKGGMVLRLLGSTRNTNDIDYTFIPYKSKNEVKDLIYSELIKLFGDKVTHEVHSNCIRYYVEHSGLKIQIEVTVDKQCDSIELSTFELAKPNNQNSKIIRVMDFASALSDKLAAWNERGLIRDLYDAYYLFSILDEKPAVHVLRQRLTRVKLYNKNKVQSMSMDEFCDKLRQAIDSLTFDKVKNELQDYLPQEQLIGLDKKLKVGIKGLLEYLYEN